MLAFDYILDMSGQKILGGLCMLVGTIWAGYNAFGHRPSKGWQPEPQERNGCIEVVLPANEYRSGQYTTVFENQEAYETFLTWNENIEVLSSQQA